MRVSDRRPAPRRPTAGYPDDRPFVPHGISVIVTAPTVLRELMRDLDVPDGVAALGYDEEDLDALVEGAMRQQRLLAGAPRPVQVGDLRHIFTASMHTG